MKTTIVRDPTDVARRLGGSAGHTSAGERSLSNPTLDRPGAYPQRTMAGPRGIGHLPAYRPSIVHEPRRDSDTRRSCRGSK
jgi:hypothetical protein